MSTQIMSLSTYGWEVLHYFGLVKYCYPNHIGILILLKVFIT